MKIFKLTLAALLLFSVLTAQENVEKEDSRFAVSFVPQYMTIGGMRFDLDFKIAEKSWLTLGPTLYYANDSYLYNPESLSLQGIGAFFNYRYFPGGKGVYTSIGANYRYLNADYLKYNETKEHDATFNTFGLDMFLGYQFCFRGGFFIDTYLGWGFRYAEQKSEEEGKYWSGGFLGLGYTGFLPVTGVRFGFEF